MIRVSSRSSAFTSVSANLRILVTGADRFIGSHLIEDLVRRGFNVWAFVYYNEQELFDQWWQKGEVQEAVNYYLHQVENTKGGSKGFAKSFAIELVDNHALGIVRRKVITTDD